MADVWIGFRQLLSLDRERLPGGHPVGPQMLGGKQTACLS